VTDTDVPDALGAVPVDGGVHFAVRSETAATVTVCLFDPATGRQTRSEPLTKRGPVFAATVDGAGPGTLYGLRADGDHDPNAGQFFDPAKLLVDPYATRIDRPYRFHRDLTAPRSDRLDTANLVPKAIVEAPISTAAPRPPVFRSGGLIYELGVRSFSQLHPDVPASVTAWIDERHLQPLGLRNAWGYNPVSFMALDPRLAPGGVADLRATVSALHDAGIGVILDVVFNHTGESDRQGPVLSLRGLDNQTYYRHEPGRPGDLVNHTGCGNTLFSDHPAVRRLIVDSLRHFVLRAGIDGFRFDLAPVLGRTAEGYQQPAELFAEMARDDVLGDRIMIAEPWDIGPDGYHLGNFPENFLEWNDQFRDTVRRFWRGDDNGVGELATRLAGSSDIFQRGGCEATRSVNFIAAHDGFTVRDLVSYKTRHNAPNGEDNRDGHGENFSWNNGVEGPTGDPGVQAARDRDVRALLATLFASRGTLLLTAGDEFGRTQNGNNNAYAQDNETTWLDWLNRDRALEDFVAGLARMRAGFPMLQETRFFNGRTRPGGGAPDVAWLTVNGESMRESDWSDPTAGTLAMVLSADGGEGLAICFNRTDRLVRFSLPGAAGEAVDVAPRSVVFSARATPGKSAPPAG
jgi:glycogen operon protein